MEKIRFKAIIHFNPKVKVLEAKTKDEAEREAQNFSCELENVSLIDVEEIYKDKDSCDEHFEYIVGCNDCKEKLKQNVDGTG